MLPSVADKAVLELFELYADIGMYGHKERRETYYLTVDGIARGTDAYLVERNRVNTFPENEIVSEDIRGWKVNAAKLAEWIMANGEEVSAPPKLPEPRPLKR